MDVMAKSKVRLSLELTEKASEVLDGLAKDTGNTKAEVIRKGIALFDVATEAKENGNSLAVVDNKNRVLHLIIGL
jgi:predicted DNA-binding protein